MINCMIAGVGGQGTVLASKLIAVAAMDKGLDVRTTETIGMAQRGGSVVSHIRMGKQIHSPLISFKAADIIIAFEPAEAVRITPFLSENGVAVVCDSAIKPVMNESYEAAEMLEYLRKNVRRLVVVNGKQLIAECGGIKTINVALLGTAVQSGVFPFNAEDMENTVKTKIPERFREMNLTALHIGRELYNES